MKNFFLVCASILLLFSASPSLQAFSAVTMTPSTMVPSASATYLLSFTPSVTVPVSGSIEVAMQSSFTWPSSLVTGDLELSVNGIIQSLEGADDDGFALGEPGTNQLTLTLPSSTSIASGASVTLLLGRRATFFNPAAEGNHSFSVATRDADGNLLESAAGVVLVEDTRSSAGATSTNEAADEGSSSGGTSASRRRFFTDEDDITTPTPVSVEDVNIFEDPNPKTLAVTENGETVYQTPEGKFFLVDRGAVDINNDGTVDILDVDLLLEHMNVYLDAAFDFDFSGDVDLRDLSILLSQWTGTPLPRATPPVPSGPALTEDTIIIKLRTNDHGNGFFSLYLLLDTGVTPVNVFSFDFTYDTERYKLIRTYSDASLITVWVTRPTEVDQGRVSLVGGMPDAFSGTDGFLLELEFEKLEDAPALEEGRTPFGIENALVYTVAGSASVVRFDTSVASIIDDEDNLLPLTTDGDVPEPLVVSSTHPEEGTWYRSREVEVSWAADPDHEEGDSYLYGISKTLQIYEDDLLETEATAVALAVPSDARWYVHVIRVRQGQQSSGTILEMDIDATPPEPFEVRKGFFLDAFERLAYIFSFAAIDELSGVSHYEVRVNEGEVEVLTNNPYVVTQPDAGKYIYEIVAVDRAGNRRAESATLTVRSPLSPWFPSALVVFFVALLFVPLILVYRRKHGKIF